MNGNLSIGQTLHLMYVRLLGTDPLNKSSELEDRMLHAK
jgi:hypothetical protein